jgi:predicted RNase H-like nuclease (RuvC/YqgF family)
MHDLDNQLQRISEKLQRLVSEYQSLQKENARLKKEKMELSERCGLLAVQSENWQQQTEILKMSKGDMNEEEKKALEKRLAQYVKRIDRCIALLSE